MWQFVPVEMDKDPAKILVVLLNSMIELANVPLIQKSQHFLLELAAALAGNNLYQLNLLGNGLLYDPIEFGVDLAASIVNVVEIKFEFSHE